MRHTKRLFLEGKEDRVDELEVLEVVVDHVVEFHALGRVKTRAGGEANATNLGPSASVTNRVEGAIFPKDRQDLL